MISLQTKRRVDTALAVTVLLTALTGIALHLKKHGILVEPRAVLKTVHYVMGFAMLACATLHASLTLRLMRPMGTKRPWFVRMAWLLLLLLAAAGVTGLLKLALPVKIPHLGLIHYWAGVMLTLSATFHLSIALPWLVAKYRKRMT